MSVTGYYDWREFDARVGDRTIRYASKPGLPGWDEDDHAARLLGESIEIRPGDRLIDLRCGRGVVVALAAQRGADVTASDDYILAVEATRRTLALNGVRASILSPGDQLPSGCDVAVIVIPKNREVVRQLIDTASAALKPGGRVYLAGANRSGVKSAIDDLAAVFGGVTTLAYGKGHRVATATRPASLEVGASDIFRQVEVEARGEVWRVVTGAGVFSRDHLDEGTRHLIETMSVRAGESLLDLGCGCGIVGLVGARLGNHVTCVDASADSVEATHRTLSTNGVRHAEVFWSDCASAVRDRQYDVVATNPPFHQGVGTDYDVARQFVDDAAAVLRPGGRLVLVANRFLRYERDMAGLFADVRVIYEDGRFRVLEAVKHG